MVESHLETVVTHGIQDESYIVLSMHGCSYEAHTIAPNMIAEPSRV